jgi:hypothetical protein
MFGGKQLAEAGVLGLNRRNADYIMRLNPRRLYPRVDDKLITKTLALEAGMAVPELYGVIRHQGDVRRLPDIVGEARELCRETCARRRRRWHRCHYGA